MKKKLKLILAFVMLVGNFIFIPKVFAAPKTQKIIFQWHHYNTGKGFYNPSDEGKKVTFPYYINFSGKDENGNLKDNLYVEKTYEGKIGSSIEVDVPVDEIKDIKGITYKDCVLKIVTVPIHKGNRFYAVSINANNPIKMQLSQNIETKTLASIKNGAIILNSDKDKLAVMYTVGKINHGNEEYPYKGKDSKIISHTINFKEGLVELTDNISFSKALQGAHLQVFSPYTGRYQEFKLHANFAGINKVDLDEKYELKMTGDDLSGWKVELSSKIKVGQITQRKEVEFKTIYQEDPNLPYGEIKVKQEGKKGLSDIKTSYYYILKDGKEKILEKHTPVETVITKAQDKIVLKGTKAVSKKKKPKTGDNDFSIYTMLIGLSGFGIFILNKKRKEV